MSFPALASVVALCLAPQTSPNPSNGGTTSSGSSSAATRSGRANPKDAHGLADILSLMQSRSGGYQGGGRFSPPSGPNVQVSSPNAASQFQPTIAVDPNDPLHLIGAAQDFRNHRQAAFYASFDGGASWSQTLEDVGSSYPCVAFGRGGEIYVAEARLRDDRGGQDIFAGRSYDGGLSFTNWLQVRTGGYSEATNIAVDKGAGERSGAVYIAFVSFVSGINNAFVAASPDGGESWSTSQVSDDSSPFINAWAAVDTQGRVGVTFFDYTRGGIFFDSSSDGGVTFGTDLKIAEAKLFEIPGMGGSFVPYPMLAIDTSGGPFNDSMYIGWTIDGFIGPDVVFKTSTDHGATWSTTARASDVFTNSQYSPSVAVDPNGTVNFGFYDCRDDPNNRKVHLYVSRSSDGGATIQPNVKVSDADFDPSSYFEGNLVAVGSAIAASDRMVHPIWTDGRHGNNDIYTAAVDLDFHTDVAVLSAATGGTVNFTLNPGPLFQNDAYWVVGSASGTIPGTDLYFVHLPLNYDAFFLWTLLFANTSDLPGFQGTLDATGAAAVSLVSGPLPPSLVGYQMDFAAVVEVGSAFRWASDATHLEIGN